MSAKLWLFLALLAIALGYRDKVRDALWSSPLRPRTKRWIAGRL